MDLELIIQLGYVVAAGLFIFGLKMLGSPDTARRGNGISAIGMLVAIVAALLDQGPIRIHSRRHDCGWHHWRLRSAHGCHDLDA